MVEKLGEMPTGGDYQPTGCMMMMGSGRIFGKVLRGKGKKTRSVTTTTAMKVCES